MRKIWVFFIVSIVISCFNSPGSAGESLKISAPPSIWAQKDGDILTGPIIELVEEIFAEVNVTVKTEVLPWARAIEYMKSGELDLIPVIFYSDERSTFMEFSSSYVDVPTSVFVPPGKSFPFFTIKDLQGRHGLMVRGDSISREFKAFKPKLDITKIATYEQILNMLGSNHADYAVAPQYGFLIHAKKLGYEHKAELLHNPIASRKLHFAFSKKSPFLKYLPAVNKKIEQLKADGSMEKMVTKAIQLAAAHKDGTP